MLALGREANAHQIPGAEAIDERRRAQCVTRLRGGSDHAGAAPYEHKQVTVLGIVGILFHALHQAIHDVRIT